MPRRYQPWQISLKGLFRERDKDFAHFLRIAAASNGETRALLYVARDRDYLTDADLVRLVELTNSIGRMLRALERHLRTKHQALGTKH